MGRRTRGWHYEGNDTELHAESPYQAMVLEAGPPIYRWGNHMRSIYWATATGAWFPDPRGGGATFRAFCSKRRAIRCAYWLADKFGKAEIVKAKPFPDGLRLVQEIVCNRSNVETPEGK